jgi:hypothetical protein
MKLGEVLGNLGAYDEESLILVAKDTLPSPGTTAMVVPIPATSDEEPGAPNFQYLIEVYTAKDVLDTWREWRENRAPTPEEAVEAILFYQENDAFLPTDEMKRQGLA